MLSNAVEIDTAWQPSNLRFAARFNVAVPFIDRHVDEGRGAKAAIRTIHGDVSYADLSANVDRCAVGLTRLRRRRCIVTATLSSPVSASAWRSWASGPTTFAIPRPSCSFQP